MSFTITKEEIQAGLQRHGIFGGSEDYLLLASVAVEKMDELQRTIDTLVQNAASQKQTHDALISRVREAEKDTARLKKLEDECLTLECYDSPTPGGDDGEVMWRVIEYHMQKPRERYIGFGNTPRKALDDAANPTEAGR